MTEKASSGILAFCNKGTSPVGLGHHPHGLINLYHFTGHVSHKVTLRLEFQHEFGGHNSIHSPPPLTLQISCSS